ncbi:MAG: hypothetical protein ACT4OF_02800 [Caulobacteraceae bacterium]
MTRWQALRPAPPGGIFARMRFTASLAASLMVVACATSAPSAPAVSTAPIAPAAASSSRQAQMLRAAGAADAPTRAEIERVFGSADIVRQDGAGAALTYRLETCALLLLFATDSRNQLRLAEAHPSARNSGEAAPSLDQCAAEASARSS